MKQAKLFLSGAAIIIAITPILIMMTDHRTTPQQMVVDLPEEIQAADSTDTLNAVVMHDTLFVTFRSKH